MSSLASRSVRPEALEAATAEAYQRFRTRYGIALERSPANDRIACCYAAYRLVRPMMTEALKGSGTALELAQAVDAYALGVGALVSLAGAADAPDGYRPSLQVSEADPDARERRLFSPLLTYHAQQCHAGQRDHGRALLASVLRSAREVVGGASASLHAAIAANPITISRATYRGLEVACEHAPAARESRYTGETMVGNQEMVLGLNTIMHRLLHYDVARDENPFVVAGYEIPRSVLIAGPPGTGKTMGVTQAFSYAQRISREKRLAPVFVHHIGNELKTGVINEGVERFNALAAKIGHEPGIHLTFIDDIDMVLFSRSHAIRHPEEQKFLHAVMSWLESARSAPPRGNQVVVGASNYLGNLDGALRGRLMECIINAPGPQSAEEYGRLLRLKLARIEKRGAITVRDWPALGGRALAHRLSGRDIKNIALSVSQAAEPADLFDKERHDYTADEIDRLSARLRSVDDRAIAEAMERYCDFLTGEKLRAHEEVVQGRLEEALVNHEVRHRLEQRFPE